MDNKKDGKRLFCCLFYLILSIVLLLVLLAIKWPPDLKEVLTERVGLILWCAFWAALGIALGLWNRRESKPQPLSHYVTYSPFILFFATMSAVAISAGTTGIVLYTRSLVTSLAIGFSGEYLGKILKV